jgi:citrate lyase subunit beta/citryl-CoA lyase
VVTAWQDAGGEGVISVAGRMIEHMHVEHARRVLALHDAATSDGPLPAD